MHLASARVNISALVGLIAAGRGERMARNGKPFEHEIDEGWPDRGSFDCSRPSQGPYPAAKC